MKINSHQNQVAKDLTTGKAKGKELHTDGKHLKSDSAEQGQGIKTSEFMTKKILDRVEAEPEVRTDKVAQLKAKIKSGEYQVDAQKLAANMLIESAREDL